MTAVQWYAIEIGKLEVERAKGYLTFQQMFNKMLEILNKAKEMERQQIIEAHGVKQKTKSNPGSIVTYGYNYTGEMYYNDKFLTPKK
ncbi:MAG: hypothetical protein ACOVOQ_02110 [Flavobacterium sp.]